MLPDVGNVRLSGNKLVKAALDALSERLPDGWQASMAPGYGAETAHIEVRAPDGRAGKVAVEVKRSLEPRSVLELRDRVHRAEGAPALVVAPYLSPAVRQRLLESGMGFIDLTGNIRFVLADPAVFIDMSGADTNPDRSERSSRSLRGGKAGRIVRALVDHKDPPGVRELATLAGANPGYVSRVMALLDQQALIEREGHGRIVDVDWPRLLERWAREAPLASRGEATLYLDPRGLSNTYARLARSQRRYAVTGTRAISDLAPVAEPRLAVIYVDDASDMAQELSLRPTERGANVMLIEASDESVFEGCALRNGLQVVAVSQAAADLLSSPGRGPAEAEALIEWMTANEEVWRG